MKLTRYELFNALNTNTDCKNVTFRKPTVNAVLHKKINLIIHKINLDEGRPSYDFMIRQFHVIR